MAKSNIIRIPRTIQFRFMTLLMSVLIVGCAIDRVSQKLIDYYDPDSDTTILVFLFYGDIKIPGKWKRTRYYDVSKQVFFKNKKSTTIAVTKNPLDEYPFYDSKQSEKEFLKNFYEWEKENHKNEGFEIKEKYWGENYMIWQASDQNTNTTFLYGTKRSFAFNFAISSDKWSEQQKIEFLKNLFDKN